MKKIYTLALLVLVSACADLSQYTTYTENDSTKTKMRACIVSEAQSKLQAGTLFSQDVKTTASSLVSTCTTKLAYNSLGISDEYKSLAETIISNMKSN